MPAYKQILVIDDEKDIAETITEIVSSFEGRKVFNANSPSEAYMRSIVQRFDLLISDFRMPKTNGVDLVKVIRGQKLNSSTPVIMISGHPEEVQEKMVDIPDVRIVAKPFLVEELLKVVDEMLALKASREHKKPQFNLEVLNEFVNATTSTIRALTGVQEIKTDKPFLYGKEHTLEMDVSCFVNMQTDKFRGTLALGFTQAIFLKLINGLSKNSYTELNSDNMEHVEAVISLIYDQARSCLKKEKINLPDKASQILVEKGHKFEMFDGHITIVIPVHALIGDFYLLAAAA